jgi:hypothetical protein
MSPWILTLFLAACGGGAEGGAPGDTDKQEEKEEDGFMARVPSKEHAQAQGGIPVGVPHLRPGVSVR